MKNVSIARRTAKGVTTKPLGVRLTSDEVNEVEGYAEKLERSRAWFLRFLILRGLADYKRAMRGSVLTFGHELMRCAP